MAAFKLTPAGLPVRHSQITSRFRAASESASNVTVRELRSSMLGSYERKPEKYFGEFRQEGREVQRLARERCLLSEDIGGWNWSAEEVDDRPVDAEERWEGAAGGRGRAMASRVHDFLDPEDGAQDEPAGRRSAGRRTNPEDMPQFGPLDLVQEIDSAEKIVKEMDRQLRSGSTVRNVVRRNGGDGSVSYEAGAGMLSQAAVGDDILGYTDLVSERQAIRSGSRIYNRSNDSTPLTHSHTRLVNVAVVERPVLPYSEMGRKEQAGPGEESFEIQEATIVPNKAGMSILMFDLCCSKGRRSAKKKRQAVPLETVPSCQPEFVHPSQLQGGSARGWDPQRDAHLYVEPRSGLPSRTVGSSCAGTASSRHRRAEQWASWALQEWWRHCRAPALQAEDQGEAAGGDDRGVSEGGRGGAGGRTAGKTRRWSKAAGVGGSRTEGGRGGACARHTRGSRGSGRQPPFQTPTVAVGRSCARSHGAACLLGAQLYGEATS